MMPVLEFNAEACPEPYAQLAAALVPGAERLDRAEAARAFLTEIRALSESTGLPQRLRDHGIPQSILPVLASEAVKIERLLRNNPREVTLADALRLYQQAW
jgi:alcohol dehydrogenase class IV